MTVTELIRAVDTADSSLGLIRAVNALAAVADPAAMKTLVDVLRFNNPGAAVAAVDGLIRLGKPVIPYLLENIDGYNYGARAWMTRVFAAIGDPRALDVLIEAANTDFSLSVRRAATKGLGGILWQDISDKNERLQWQQKVLDCLLLALEDGEWVVRYGAIAGLEGLTSSLPEEWQIKACEQLKKFMTTETEIVVRARCWQALKQISLDNNLAINLDTLTISNLG